MKVSRSPLSEKSIGTVLIALAGPLTIWALHFAVVYGIHPVFCVIVGGSRAGLSMQIAVFIATLAALLALLALIFKPEGVIPDARDESTQENPLSFLIGVMRLLSLLSLFGVLWAGSAAIFLPACQSLV